MLFYSLYCYLWTYSTPSSTAFVEFECVNASWEKYTNHSIVKKLFSGLFFLYMYERISKRVDLFIIKLLET